MGPPGETDSCNPLGGHEQGGTGTAAVDWAWALQEKTAPPQQSQDQGSRQWRSEDWRGEAVGDAGAEVTMLFWLKLACLYTQLQALGSTDT